MPGRSPSGRDGRVGRDVAGDRVRAARGVPVRAVRPREHGAGGLEHRARARPRGDGRSDRRPARAPRPPRRSDPRALGARWIVFRPRDAHHDSGCRGRGGSAARVLARAAAHGLGAGRRPARAHVSRVSVDRVDRARRLPSRCLRDPALPVLCLVSRLRQALLPSRPARSSPPATGSRWLSRSERSASGMHRALARSPRGGGLIAAVALVVGGRRPRGRRARLLGGESLFYGATRTSGSPAGVLRTAVTDPLAIASAVTHGRRRRATWCSSRRRWRGCSLAPGLALVALPQLSANVLADREHTTDPHVHYVAAIVPFLFAAVAVGLARLSPAGRARAVALALTLSVAATIAIGPWPRSLLGASDWDTLGTLDTSRQSTCVPSTMLSPSCPVTRRSA